MWYDADGSAVQSRQLLLCRRQLEVLRRRADPLPRRGFRGIEHADGASPAWPFRYDELEPWYDEAEKLFQVRGTAGEDPTEPPRAVPYPFPPVPDEPPIAAVRERLSARSACIRFRCRSASTSTRWLAHGKTPWDAFPDTRTGKMDAETCALSPALAYAKCGLRTVREVTAAGPGGGRQADRGGGLSPGWRDATG